MCSGEGLKTLETMEYIVMLAWLGNSGGYRILNIIISVRQAKYYMFPYLWFGVSGVVLLLKMPRNTQSGILQENTYSNRVPVILYNYDVGIRYAHFSKLRHIKKHEKRIMYYKQRIISLKMSANVCLKSQLSKKVLKIV